MEAKVPTCNIHPAVSQDLFLDCAGEPIDHVLPGGDEVCKQFVEVDILLRKPLLVLEGENGGGGTCQLSRLNKPSRQRRRPEPYEHTSYSKVLVTSPSSTSRARSSLFSRRNTTSASSCDCNDVSCWYSASHPHRVQTTRSVDVLTTLKSLPLGVLFAVPPPRLDRLFGVDGGGSRPMWCFQELVFGCFQELVLVASQCVTAGGTVHEIAQYERE